MSQLDLQSISATVLNTFRDLLHGPLSRLYLFETGTEREYNLLAEVLTDWMLYYDSNGNFVKIFINQSSDITYEMLNRANGFGFYIPRLGIEETQCLIYSPDSKAPIVSEAIIMWIMTCSINGDIKNVNN